LCHPLLPRLGEKKRTALALEIAHQLEQEGHFPLALYAAGVWMVCQPLPMRGMMP